MVQQKNQLSGTFYASSLQQPAPHTPESSFLQTRFDSVNLHNMSDFQIILNSIKNQQRCNSSTFEFTYKEV